MKAIFGFCPKAFAPIRSTLHFIFAMTVLMAPGFSHAYTDGDWSFSYSGSTATITGYSGSSSVVTIPSTVTRTEEYREQDDDGEWHTRYRYYHDTVTAIGGSVFKNKTSLTSATIPSSVTSIGSALFYGCTSLRSVSIYGNITSIPSSCFYGCSSLSSFSIPSSVTTIDSSAFYGCRNWSPPSSFSSSLQRIGNNAFQDCVKFRAVALGPNVTSLGPYAFYGCDQITSMTVDSPVTLPSKLFGNCSNLVSVVIGDRVKGLGSSEHSHPFYQCPKIKTFHVGSGITEIPNYYFYNLADTFPASATIEQIDLPNTITAIGQSAFSGCGNADFGELSLPNLKSIGNYAFSGCRNLEPFVFPDSLTSIGAYAFQDCVKLRAVALGPNVTSLGVYAFYGCDQITSVTVDSPVTLPSNLFGNCSNLVSVVIGDRVKGLGSSDGDHPFRQCPKIKTFHVGSGITEIPNYYFYNLADTFPASATIEQIDLPNTITAIGQSAFSGCGNADFGELSLPNLKSIGNYAFQDCVKLRAVALGPNVTSLGAYAFYGCDQITSVTVDSPVTLPLNLFGNCSNLVSVVIGDRVKGLGSYGDSHPFYRCPKIKTFHVGSGITEIPARYFDNVGDTFTASATIEQIDLPNTITNIGQSAFYGCGNADFGELSLPNLKSIRNYAFYGCRNLKSFVFPDSLTSIGAYAFQDCVKFRAVALGPNVTSLGHSAFYGCDQITSVTVDSPVTLPSNLFGNCSNLVSVVIGDRVKGLGTSENSHPFRRCPKIKTFHVGSGITEIPAYYFDNSASATIEQIDLPNTITDIGQSAFSGCGNADFGELSLPNLKSIGNYAFYGCRNLESFVFPDSLTSIGYSTFSGCSGITNATIPKSVTLIGSYAFDNCSSLTNVWLEGEPPTTGSYVFRGVAPGARGHYPRSLASEWLSQIDSNGKWKGLIMNELSQPVLRVKSASPVDGSITLAWDDGTDGQRVSSYAIYRGPGPERLPEYFIEGGITETEWTDHGYWNAEPVLSPLNYWVVAENDHFDIPESNAVETRRRYALCVGYGSYGHDEKPLVQARNDAELAAENLSGMAGFTRVKTLTDSAAKLSDIRREIQSFATEVKSGDTFVFYISTHGKDKPVPKIAAYDKWYLIGDFQRDMFSITNTATLIEIVMACHSESLVDGSLAEPFVVKWLANNGFIPCRVNTAWIAACRTDQYAPTFGTYSGFGEWFLNQGWKNGMADRELFGFSYGGGNRDGVISLLEVARYATPFARGISDTLPADLRFEKEGILDKVLVGLTPSIAVPGRPTAPENVSASKGLFDTKISLSWDSSPEATAYRVFRGEPGDDVPTFCRSFAYRGGTSIKDSYKITGFSLYTYSVFAINPSGISEESNRDIGWAGSANLAKYLWHQYLDYRDNPNLINDAQQLSAASVATAANGMSVLTTYIAGLDPKDPNARFESRIDMVDGVPVVTPSPDLGTNRVYTVEGKSSLSDTNEVWHAPDENSRFFRVKVALPE